jgi:tripartite-type tricarboxylate transporter receptor subunit TctC
MKLLPAIASAKPTGVTRRCRVLLGAVLFGWAIGHALAQADPARGYPERPIRLVVPFGPAGGITTVARIVATKMSESFGQPVIVENKPGAQGIIACELVQKAAPDGYTILVGTNGPMSINPALYAKLGYQPLRDFTPVAMIGSFAYVLVVNSSLPVKTVQELITYAKARPNSINYGAAGALGQLVTEYFNQQAGTTFLHIPYKSGGDYINAVLANEVTIVFAIPPEVLAHVRAGRLRALAIASSKRHSAWPDVPTMPEAGLPNIVIEIWSGLFVPAGTPAPIVRRLQEEVERVVALPDVRERFDALGTDPSGMPGEDFAKVVAADIGRWTAVARTANIKAE